MIQSPEYQRLLQLCNQIYGVKLEPTYEQQVHQEIQELIIQMTEQLLIQEIEMEEPITPPGELNV